MADIGVPPRASFAARLGWRIERRPKPGFAHVLGAAAGAFLVVAVVAFVVEVASDDPTAPGVAFDALLVALALVLGTRAPGPLRAACVTAVVLAVPLVWGFGFLGAGNAGRGEVRGVYLLTLVSYLVLYLVGWTKGRAILLAGALLVFATWASFEVAGNGNRGVVPLQDQFSTSSGSSSSFGSSGSDGTTYDLGQSTPLSSSGSSSSPVTSLSSNNTDSAGATALVIGLAFLAAGAVLDRKRYQGAATPFVAIGAIEALGGAVELGGSDSLLAAGLLTVAAGIAVGLVGAHGDRRRGTTWIGVLAVFGGLVAVLVDIKPDSAGAVGGIALGFAVALVAVAWWLAPVLGEPDDGNEPPEPPTASPGGDTLPGPAAAAA